MTKKSFWQKVKEWLAFTAPAKRRLPKVQQRIVNLHRSNGRYYNFFQYEIKQWHNEGWILKDSHLDKENQCGWVLMERTNE